MPCWYYDRQELRQMCSFGLDPEIEARYRKEGARFILDCGGKMGLRYETSATGVVYFHRFYLFHSFKEFNRHLTAACCLFLAGKVEETPKKCKDIIKVARGMLSDQQFAVFGDDPRRQQEEVMTMERILLQTIKFDLQVEHPYAYLLKFAKMLKENVSFGDKPKIQHMVQMAWTFINDSMCTTLCLQWEPDIIAIALMYLASRLTKFDIHDWQGKTPTSKGKWWDHLVEDVTLDLLEDICHQVLDLYSPAPKKREIDSPPPPPPPPRPQAQPPGPHKRSRSNTPSEQPSDNTSQDRTVPPPSKMSRTESGHHSKSPSPTPAKQEARHPKGNRGPMPRGPSTPTNGKARSGSRVSPAPAPNHPGGPHTGAGGPPGYGRQDGMSYNPYMSSSMYSSSFMSQEGAQSIQSLIGGGGGGGSAPPSSGPPPPTAQSAGYTYNQPTPPGQYSQPPVAQGAQNYPHQQPYQNYPQQPPPSSYPPPRAPLQPPYQPYQPPQQQTQPQQPPQPGGYNQYQYPGYGAQQPAQNQNYPQQQGYPPQPPQHPSQPAAPPPQQSYPQQYPPPQYQSGPPAAGPPPTGQYNYQGQPPGPGGFQPNFQGAPGQGFPPRGPPHNSPHPPPQVNASTGLAQVRITGRR